MTSEISPKKYYVYVLSNTHWDREWYMPHEKYLVRLVSLCDKMLDIMESRREFVFITDGQYSMISDYLTTRPKNTERVKALVAEGRLEVGPWFTQPLETLISGEAMIRNLHYGIEGAESLGRAMRFSYEVDQFGHASQTPQILRGFGIDGALAWRGMPVGSRSAFEWVAPDGSPVVMLYTNWGYGEATDLPVSRADYTENIDGKEYTREGLDKKIASRRAREILRYDRIMWQRNRSFLRSADILDAIAEVIRFIPSLACVRRRRRILASGVKAVYADKGATMQRVKAS